MRCVSSVFLTFFTAWRAGDAGITLYRPLLRPDLEALQAPETNHSRPS